jgi:hypothetical protein
MLQISDPSIVNLIERISAHYKSNIANRYIRPALLQMSLDKETWDLVDILTEKVEQFRYQGFMLDDLYRQIGAVARLVSLARRELAPNLRNRLSGLNTAGPDKVMRDMAVNNFKSNLQVFADLVNELLVKLVELDKAAARGRMPVYARTPELKDIGSQLVEG